MINDQDQDDLAVRAPGHIDDTTFWLDRALFDTDSSGRLFAHELDEIIVETSALAVDGNKDRIGTVRGRRDLPGGFVLLEVDEAPARIRSLRRVRARAHPNHLFFADAFGNPVTFGNPFWGGGAAGCGCSSCYGTYQPATRPEDVPRKTLARAVPDPGPSSVDGAVGDKMTVLIVDTGLAHTSYRPAFSPSVPDLNRPEVEIPNVDDDGSVDSTAGHGTFIAGIIERMAPGAHIKLKRMLSTFGVGDDATIGEYLDSIPVDDLPNIINLSFGSYTEDDEPPVVISEAIRGLIDKGDQRRKDCPGFQGPYIVASAGNSASCRKSWPAALPEVISVGAICATGPAPFSNFGPWVKACAPGVDIVSKFFFRDDPTDPPAPIPVDADGAHFHGWAKWSGTSFSAPIVIGALLQRRHVVGSLDQAVQDLIYDPRLTRMPGLGAIVNAYP